MIVTISARMQALGKNGFSGNFAAIDDAISMKANPILLEQVRKSKHPCDVDGIHPMRDQLQNRDKGTFLYIDPLLDDERSINQIMAGLGFQGRPIVFDKSRSSSWG
ncbi:hypothetical protein [Acidithiobacillus ferriphilus]|uniref:hypothetical protein n=1 Tax=Acidithiobacillus ferriphilus TaxID=1689834 RepID=UPI002DB8A1E6|nr:hypothetical protein [Acidithiobacillus ferriphilus]MEB8475864.1 hypothetical protein [Acidithiobacillus ferriphilus]